MNSQQLLDFAFDKVDDMKAKNIVTLDVRNKSSVTDYLVICSGTSKRHVQSIADHVAKEARHAGEVPLGYEGQRSRRVGTCGFRQCRGARDARSNTWLL